MQKMREKNLMCKSEHFLSFIFYKLLNLKPFKAICLCNVFFALCSAVTLPVDADAELH